MGKSKFGPKTNKQIDEEISRHFGVPDIYNNQNDNVLPDYKRDDAKFKDVQKEKYERRKNIIINQSEGIKEMLKVIQAILEWLPKIKNIVTTILGLFGAVAYFLQEYYATNGNPKWYQVVIALAVFVIGYFTGKPGTKQTPSDMLSILFLISAVYILDSIFFTASGVSLAVITALSGQTKSASQKTTRGRSFAAKEAAADSYVALPSDCLKSVKCSIKGVNDPSAFGDVTMGQEISGELIVYAAEATIRTYCHELVTKKIEGAQLTTNSGQTYAFATSDGTPALSFAYDEAVLVSEKDDPTTIKLKITGFRDNLPMS